MIRLIHKYNKSISYVFVFIAACFILGGLLGDFSGLGRGGKRPYAVKVGDREFSFEELRDVESRIDNQYRQMFGDNYPMLARTLKANLPQQALDTLIDSHLIEKEGDNLGFAADPDQVTQYIMTKVFDQSSGQGLTRENAKALFQRLGMTAAELEQTVGRDIVRTAFSGLLSDVGFQTMKEVEAGFIKQETKYSFLTARVAANDLLSEVPTPSEDVLAKYYENNATEYELPARVRYDYAILDPKDFLKDVTVTPQDIEIYYTDNTQKYATPESAKVRSIKLLYPKESDPVKMAAVKEKAEKVYQEALVQKNFEGLVATYSDDVPSKATGGLRGWVVKGSERPEFDKNVFATPGGQIAALIESDFGFEIVKVEEKKDAGMKSLDEVRSQIESEIREREAPAYAAARAKEISDKAKQGKLSLTDAAKSFETPVSTTKGLIEESSDPDPSVPGLTRRVVAFSSDERTGVANIDSGDRSVLVQGLEFTSPSTPPLADVKEKVIATYKQQEASKLAEKRAKEILDLARTPGNDFSKIAREKHVKLEGPLSISRANPTPEKSELPADVSQDILQKGSVGVVDRPFRAKEGFDVIDVTSITPPDLAAPTTQKDLEKFKTQANSDGQKMIMESTLARLKAKTKIDFDPSVLANS